MTTIRLCCGGGPSIPSAPATEAAPPPPPEPAEVADTVESATDNDKLTKGARRKRGKAALIIEREPSTGQSGAGLQV